MSLPEELLTQLRADLERDLADTRATLEGLSAAEGEPLREMLEASVKDLEAALKKLEAGGYGQCESCGAAIGELRLRSLPASRLCLRCEGVTTTALPV